MIFNTMCGGGAGLNFKIVGGTTVPGSPTENTIWINTNSEITSYVFSSTTPASMSEGMLWITVGSFSSGAFSVTKKNPIMIYPILAKQYVGGTWVNKSVKHYRSGAWYDWLTYLYNNGDTCDTLTGGWTGAGGALTLNPSTMTMRGDTFGGSIAYGALHTTGQIDLTAFKTLTFVVSGVTLPPGDTEHDYLLSVFSSTPYGDFNDQNKIVTSVKISQAGTYSIDVSGISGPYYVGVRLKAGGYVNPIITISEVNLQ